MAGAAPGAAPFSGVTWRQLAPGADVAAIVIAALRLRIMAEPAWCSVLVLTLPFLRWQLGRHPWLCGAKR